MVAHSGGGGNGAEGGRERGADAARRGPLRARDLLRGALVGDDDPRLPWWLPLPGVALALAWAAYQGASGGGAAQFAGALLWPGLAILAFATAATFFGWQLDID